MRKQMSTCKRRKRSQGLKGSLNPSKRHRDRFNIELDNLAKLLPFSQDVICKLDKLSILRLSASYLRAKNFFKDISKQNVSFPTILGEKKNSAVERLDTENGSLQFSDLLLEALDGFIMVLTNDAEIFYISETVQEYLGLTQASVIHQDFLRFIHVDDHHMISDSLKPNPQKQKKDKDNKSDIKNNILKPFGNEEENEKADNEKDKCDMEQLELAEKESIKIEQEEKEEELEDNEVNLDRSFVCRLKCILNTSAGFFRPFRCTGRVRDMTPLNSETPEYGLFLICSPLEVMPSVIELRLRSTLFCTKHKMDFTVMDIDAKGRQLLGYSKKEVVGKSFYCLIHYDDMTHFKRVHNDLITTGKSQGAYRLLSKSFKWQWITSSCQVVYKGGTEPDFIMTTNRPLSNDEGDDIIRKRDDFGALGQPFLNFPIDEALFSPSFSSHSSSSLNGTGSSPSNHDSDQGSHFSPRSGHSNSMTSLSSMGSMRSSGSLGSFGSIASPSHQLSSRKKSHSFTDASMFHQDASTHRSHEKHSFKMQSHDDSTTCTSPFSPVELDNLGFDEDSLIMDPQDLESWELGGSNGNSRRGRSAKGESNSDLVNSLQMLDFRSATSPISGLPTYEEALALAEDCLKEFSDCSDIMDALDADENSEREEEQRVPVVTETTEQSETASVSSSKTPTPVPLTPTNSINEISLDENMGTKRKRKVATVMPPFVAEAKPENVDNNVQQSPCVNLSWNESGQVQLSDHSNQSLPSMSTLVTSPNDDFVSGQGAGSNLSTSVPPNVCLPSPSGRNIMFNNSYDNNPMSPIVGWRSPSSSCSSNSSINSIPTTEGTPGYMSPLPPSNMMHGARDRWGSFSCLKGMTISGDEAMLQVDRNAQRNARRSVPATHKYGWCNAISPSPPSPTNSTPSSSRGQLAPPEPSRQRLSLPATHVQGWGKPSLNSTYKAPSTGDSKSQARLLRKSLPESHMFGWNPSVVSEKSSEKQNGHKRQRKISLPPNQMYGWHGSSSATVQTTTSPTYQMPNNSLQQGNYSIPNMNINQQSYSQAQQMIQQSQAHQRQMDSMHQRQLMGQGQIQVLDQGQVQMMDHASNINHNQGAMLNQQVHQGMDPGRMNQAQMLHMPGSTVMMNQNQAQQLQRFKRSSLPASHQFGWNSGSPEHTSLSELLGSNQNIPQQIQYGQEIPLTHTSQNHVQPEPSSNRPRLRRRQSSSLPETHMFGWNNPSSNVNVPSPVQQQAVVSQVATTSTSTTVQNRMAARRARFSLPATHRYGWDVPQNTPEMLVESGLDEPQINSQIRHRLSLPATQHRYVWDNATQFSVAEREDGLSGLNNGSVNSVDDINGALSPMNQPDWVL